MKLDLFIILDGAPIAYAGREGRAVMQNRIVEMASHHRNHVVGSNVGALGSNYFILQGLDQKLGLEEVL